MDGLDYWRLCDQLDVVQAALLICGHDPSGEQSNVEERNMEQRPQGYEAAKTAVSNALRKELIEGRLIPLLDCDSYGNPCGEIENSIDLTASRVEVESLRSWLAGRGLHTGFFFPAASGDPDYLDPDHPRYAPKLAAAAKAWLACGDESATRGKSAKQALMRWLRENASEFGLSDDDGKPNETGIEETAKVANWQLGGGAPKTPSG
ncbi:MAG: hypothetical protein GY953_19865 [bacterium]|nr:hypothetical protein [bacterium]